VKDTIPMFLVSQGSAEALIRWGGKYSIFWLLTFSVIFLPNIMKIRQCFLELLLKTSGMFLGHSVE